MRVQIILTTDKSLLQKAPANDILRLHQHHQQQQQQQSLSSSKSSGGSQGSTPTSSDMNLYQQITTTTTTASSGAKNHPRIKYSGIKNIITQQQQQQRQQQHQQEQQQQQEQTTLADSIHSTSATDLMMGEFVKYADIDDIELADGTQIGYHPATKYETTTQPTATIITTKDNHSPPPAAVSSVVALTIKTAPTTPTANNAVLVKGAKTSPSQSDGATGGVHNNQNVSETSFSMAEKYSIIAANALKNFDFSSLDLNSSVEDGEKLYSCQHCGKKYRWKSTLRRHENDECGNKEPAHQCPYCPYKAKQRGNLGVHVRKHHSELPQLESRRKKRGSI